MGQLDGNANDVAAVPPVSPPAAAATTPATATPAPVAAPAPVKGFVPVLPAVAPAGMDAAGLAEFAAAKQAEAHKASKAASLTAKDKGADEQAVAASKGLADRLQLEAAEAQKTADAARAAEKAAGAQEQSATDAENARLALARREKFHAASEKLLAEQAAADERFKGVKKKHEDRMAGLQQAGKAMKRAFGAGDWTAFDAAVKGVEDAVKKSGK